MSRGSAAREGLALADRAYDLVQKDPGQAVALAERALAVARKERDPEAQVAALHALSWAQRGIGDPRALRTARAGIRIGEKHGVGRRLALLRRNYSHTLAFAGHTQAARREIEVAIAGLRGIDRAQSEVFRIVIHRSAHSADLRTHRAVLAAAARALPVLERDGDPVWTARLLYNRAALHADRGELDEADADLVRAVALYREAHADAAVVDAVSGRAEVAVLRGDVVSCLATLDRIRAELPAGTVSFNLDYAEMLALSQARLLPEADRAITDYIDACARSGRADYVPAALLHASAIALRSGDPRAALRHAQRATRYFDAHAKPLEAAQARAACLRARLHTGSLKRSSVDDGLEAAGTLETAGWTTDALRTRLLVARVALANGSIATARRELDLARRLRRLGTVFDRIELAYARALLHVAEANSRAAERSLTGGLGLLDDYQAALGAPELRATAASIGKDLSELGLRLAFESGKPSKILEWAERLRANALRLPPVRAPRDPVARAQQVELRNVAGWMREAERDGRPTTHLAARQTELEHALRDRTRRARGAGTTLPREDAEAAARVLGDRVLVEYVELDGALRALTLAQGRIALHELGEVSVADELLWLRHELRRLTRRESLHSSALRNVRASATALDRILVEPLLADVGAAPLVVVPTHELHALPWGMLPSLRGRPVVVAPSFTVWLRLSRRRRSRHRKSAFVAGPDLPHARAEVRRSADFYTDPKVLTGKAATADAVLEALDGAALAHVACHGDFRSDSPLFSSLALVDGPLNALTLQGLRRAPDRLILSACDLALSRWHPGDELLGVSAALLAMGTRTIVASVIRVPDTTARRVMLAFHAQLARGVAPAAALARAQADLSGSEAAFAGFVCLGAG